MDFLSINNLLYGTGITILLILAIIIVSLFIKKERVQKPPDPDNGDEPFCKKKPSLVGLHNTRILKGAKASEHYARQYESHIIDLRASMVECTPNDCSEEVQKLVQTSEGLHEYRQLSEKNAVPKPPRKPEFFVMLHNFANSAAESGSKSLAPIYEFLLKLNDALPNEKLMVVNSILARYHNKFEIGKIRDRQFSILIKALSRLAKRAREAKKLFKSIEQKDRQYAVSKIQDGVRKALDDLENARPEIEGVKIIPEISYLKSLLKNISEVARSAAIQEAWKPDFIVTFPSKENSLIVESQLITLEFRVFNKNFGQAPVKDVNIQLMSLSNDLKAKDENYTIELSVSGKADLQVTMRSFAFDTDETDPEPTIRFLIKYFLKGESLTVEQEVTLPRIVVRKKIINPFREGISGKALPGDSNLFTGRYDLLSELSRDMVSSSTAPLFYVLYGHPRSGKTSILKQLAENPKWLKEKYFHIWTNAELIRDVSNYYEQLFDLIKEILREKLGIHIRQPDEKKRYKDIPWWRIIDLLRLNAEDILETKKRLLLVIDEYQELAIWDEHIAKGKEDILVSNVPYQFPEFIKVIRDEYDKLMTVVMDGQLSLEELEASGSQGRKWIQFLGGRLTQKNVTNFASTEADEMLEGQFKEFGINISQDILHRIKLYTKCHPWLQMLIGYHLFQELIDESGFGLRQDKKIRPQNVDNAARKIRGADMKFAWTEPWLIKNYDARVLLATLGEYSYRRSADMGDPTLMPEVTIEEINDFLHYQLDVEPELFEFDSIIAALLKKQLILEATDRRKFKLFYPLYAIFAHNTGLIHEILNEEYKG